MTAIAMPVCTITGDHCCKRRLLFIYIGTNWFLLLLSLLLKFVLEYNNQYTIFKAHIFLDCFYEMLIFPPTFDLGTPDQISRVRQWSSKG